MSRKFDINLDNVDDGIYSSEGCFYYDFGHGVKIKETVKMRKKLEKWRNQRRNDQESIDFKSYVASVFDLESNSK